MANYCEEEGITYTIALITNERLKQTAGDLLEAAIEEHESTDEKVRLFGEGLYKAEAMQQGICTEPPKC